MKSRKQVSMHDVRLFENAAKIIVLNALASRWKEWERHYQKEATNRVTVKRLAQAAAIIKGLAHLAGTSIHPKKGVVYSMFGNILAENEIQYLPHHWRRLSAKGDAVLSGVSPGEVVKLPRKGNQNRTGKTNAWYEKRVGRRLDDSNSLTDHPNKFLRNK